MPKRNFTIVLVLLAALWITISTQAQENLLQNPGFNNSTTYNASSTFRSDFNIAQGWNGWDTNTPSTAEWMNADPIGFPHTAGFKREGDASQNIGRGDATFTAAVYQTIGGIAEGSTFRFSAWVYQDSQDGSGSQTRVGIGSNVGGNPLGSPITWSPWMTSIDSWQEVSVEATVPSGSITVFIYSTQSAPRASNQNYYDDASLVLLNGDGTVDVGDGQETVDEDGEVVPPPPPTSTPQTFAPFVSVQPTQEGGRVTHTVVTGDTLAAIAVAYGLPSSEILELNGLTRDEARFLRIGQVLVISEGNPEAETSEDDTDETDDTAEADETEEAEEADETEEPEEDTSDQSSGFASPTPQEVAQEPTDIPTPTATAEPEESPTPTEIPATPTNAPTAPVEQGDDTDPLNIVTGICVLMFDDANANTIQEGDESLLEGGQIALSDSTNTVVADYVTDGSEPFCFEDIASGNYTLRGTAPDGYGLNTSLRAVNLPAGEKVDVAFAAIEGLEVAAIPTVNAVDEVDDPIIEEDADPLANLRNIAGILVLGIAGAVLLGGIVVGVIVGRNN